MLVQVQAAIRAARPSGRADHQAQHAVAPAADQVLIGLSQQVIDFVHPFRVDLAQGFLAKIVTGIEERYGLWAGFAMGGHPAEVFLEIVKQGRAAAAVTWIEQEVLHVDRDELLGAAEFVGVRAAIDLAVVLLALATPADVLGPAGQVKEFRVIAQGEAAVGLATALVRQADLAHTGILPIALLDQPALRLGPQTGAVIDVGQLMQDGRQQFFAHRAVGAMGLGCGGAAIGEARQQFAVQIQAGDRRGLAIGILAHVCRPADIDAPIQALDKTGRQSLHGLVKQRLAGLLLRRAEAIGLQDQLQAGRCRICH
ncbi:hypothetical protein D9M71_153000 [compost metagenome]